MCVAETIREELTSAEDYGARAAEALRQAQNARDRGEADAANDLDRQARDLAGLSRLAYAQYLRLGGQPVQGGE